MKTDDSAGFLVLNMCICYNGVKMFSTLPTVLSIKKENIQTWFQAVLYEEKWQEFQKDFKPKLILTKCGIKRKSRTRIFNSEYNPEH